VYRPGQDEEAQLPSDIYRGAGYGGFISARLGDGNVYSGGNFVSCIGPSTEIESTEPRKGAGSLPYMIKQSSAVPGEQIYTVGVQIIEFTDDGQTRGIGTFPSNKCRITTPGEDAEIRRNRARAWGW
jgi:hypothetical protein